LTNEEDLPPVETDDGEALARPELALAKEAAPDESLLHRETQEEWSRLKTRFKSFLGEDQVLKEVFECQCAGILKRAAIARKLGVSAQVVTRAQKRLKRRLAEFQREVVAGPPSKP